MSKAFKVSAEFVMLTVTNPLGQRIKMGLYRNAMVPGTEKDGGPTEAEIKHHLSTGQLVEVEIDRETGEVREAGDGEDLRQTNPAEATVTDGLGDPSKGPGEVGATDDDGPTGHVPSPQVVAGDDVPEPKRNGERSDWVDYAVSKGADRSDIEANEVSRADLIAAWGTPR